MARKMGFLGPWLQQTTGQTVADDALRVAVGVHPEYLETAFGAIRERHGSLDASLTDDLGVYAALRPRIHERLRGCIQIGRACRRERGWQHGVNTWGAV